MDQVELSLRFTVVTWPPEKALSSIPECDQKAEGLRPSTPPFSSSIGSTSTYDEEVVNFDRLRSTESSKESLVGVSYLQSSNRIVKRGADVPTDPCNKSRKKNSDDDSFSLGSLAFGSFLSPVVQQRTKSPGSSSAS